MQFIGVLKRVLPFLLSFAAGLLVSSFFVPLTMPFEKLESDCIRSRRSGYVRLRDEKRKLQDEVIRLRLENERYRFHRSSCPIALEESKKAMAEDSAGTQLAEEPVVSTSKTFK